MARLAEEKLSQPKATSTPLSAKYNAELAAAQADRLAAEQAKKDAEAALMAATQNIKMNPFEAPKASSSPATVPAGTPSGKKKIGEGKWTHPVLGFEYRYPIYEDGSSALKDWFASIGGESKATEYIPGKGYLTPDSDPAFRPFFTVLPEFPVQLSQSATSSSATAAAALAAKQAEVYTAEDGTKFTDQSAFVAYTNILNQQKALQGQVYQQKRDAFSLLKEEFNRYGIGELVGDVEALVRAGLSPSEFAIELRKTPTYQKRFQANQQRIHAGLRAISEAEYIQLEDQYQNIMRQYGLPASYYEKNQFGKQANLDKFIALDISPVELEDRLQTGFKRVQDANPEVLQALKAYYPDLTNGDILSYVLDPKQAIADINRKVQAAEIGGEALRAGLAAAAPQRGITGVGVTDAEYLARYGVTKEQARQGYQTIAGGLERGKQLSDIYQQPQYTQTTAEQEVFALPGATEAARQRKRLTQLEQATFGGQTGMASGALARDRAGSFQAC